MTRWTIGLLVGMLAAVPAIGRTIELTKSDLTNFAAISPEAPRLSWAGSHSAMPPDQPKYFGATVVDLYQPRQMLLRFDLSKIPSGMRITSAELIMPVNYVGQPTTRLLMTRLTSSWGPGVSYQYRMTRPEKKAWTKPGALAPGSDRALGPATRIRVAQPATQIQVTVTTDVELWYSSGGVNNHGWIIAPEDAPDRVIFPSPIWQSADRWKLRVTFEPE